MGYSYSFQNRGRQSWTHQNCRPNSFSWQGRYDNWLGKGLTIKILSSPNCSDKIYKSTEVYFLTYQQLSNQENILWKVRHLR